MITATASVKRCNSCHKDVTHDQRMKDGSGRYWCVACGTAHQKKKALLAAEHRAQSKANRSKGAGKGWLVKLLVVMGLLAVGAAWKFSSMQ
jgi:hypothetical protein